MSVTEGQIRGKYHQDTNVPRSNLAISRIHKNIERHTAHTIVSYNSVQNFIFATKFSSIYLEKGQKRLFFQLSFVNLQRAKDGTHMFDAKFRFVFVV